MEFRRVYRIGSLRSAKRRSRLYADKLLRRARLSRFGLKPWDRQFLRWIEEAEATGQDPNDIGDATWSGTRLPVAEEHYFPHITPDSVVLELGPGTGRVTRYLIGRCREMILVDYSRVVCEWLPQYLEGKGRFRVHQIERPAFPEVDSDSVDTVIANGVFHHIDPYPTWSFLHEIWRVLRPGGIVSFDFIQFCSEGGIEFFREHRPATGMDSIFRFYHPEEMRTLASTVGFDVIKLTTDESRLCFLEARKPLSAAACH